VESPDALAGARVCVCAAEDLAESSKPCSIYATSSTTMGISIQGQIAWRRSLLSREVDIVVSEEWSTTV
jgi:hypothetical protein